MKNKIKKYLLIKISLIFSIFLLFNFLVLLANVLGFKSLQQELVNHQVAKINKNNDIVFLGDSSLGHAINSNLWSELSDKPTSNMALTGNFSFAGAYAILEEIIEYLPKNNIFILFVIKLLIDDDMNTLFFETYYTKNNTQFEILINDLKEIIENWKIPPTEV